MKNSIYTYLKIFSIFTVLCVFVKPSYSGGGNPGGNTAGLEELTSGHWVLSDSKSDVINKSNITKWSEQNHNITAVTSWVDKLNIENTLSAAFRFQEPPQVIDPGADLSIQTNYTNVDYSTPVRVLEGIKINIDKAGRDCMALSSEGTEVMNLVKDNKQHSNEVKTGFFTGPKHLLDDTRQFQLTIDCFSGNDHYVTTYIYTYEP